MKIKTVELFCGTKSFSKYARKIGCKTFTVDNNPDFKPDLVCNLSYEFPLILNQKIREAKIIWLSPPCTTFSMASGNKHWDINRKPKTKEAIEGKRLIKYSKSIMTFCENNKKIYFIENPRARARWFLPEYNRITVWYCQYGDNRAKPTDIWHNLKNWEGKQCKNNSKTCNHERAPRGSKTGTQGLKGRKERGRIPEALFKEIFNHIKKEKIL